MLGDRSAEAMRTGRCRASLRAVVVRAITESRRSAGLRVRLSTMARMDPRSLARLCWQATWLASLKTTLTSSQLTTLSCLADFAKEPRRNPVAMRVWRGKADDCLQIRR